MKPIGDLSEPQWQKGAFCVNVNKAGYAYYADVAAKSGPARTVKAEKTAEAAPAAKAEETVLQEEALDKKDAAFLDEAHSMDVIQFTSEEENDGRESLQELLARLEESKNAFKIKSSVPSDSSGRLAERLVAATDQTEVRLVMSEASRALTSLQNAAAFAEKKDRAKIEAMIRKMQKLLDQGSKKIRGLGDEDALRGQQVKAKKAKQEVRAQQLKEELRRKMAERERRERAYLQEAKKPVQVGSGFEKNVDAQPVKGEKLDAVSEAQITAEAEAMAAAEFASGGGDVALGADAALPGGEGASGAEGGAQAAAGAEVAAGGDVAVSAAE